MRWQIAYSTALLVGTFWTSEAFTLATPRFQHATAHSSRSSSQRNVGGMGWDNDNFLDSLGQGPEERDAANEQYQAQSRYQPEEDLSEEGTVGAELTKDMIEKVKASHTEDEERSQGGTMFKNLMNRAQQGGDSRMSTPPPPPPPPPMPSPENLTVEEQARMFREMMMQQQQMGAPPPQQQQQPEYPQTKQPQAFPQAFPPQGQPLAPDGRRYGRNRDADAIVNTSDVYFAQLKQDSTARILARRSGDEEYANEVFKDPRIKGIKMHVNPHLEEAKKVEKAMLETSIDEMLIPFEEEKEVDRSYSGVSYKEKLKQRGQGSARSPSANVTPKQPPQQQQELTPPQQLTPDPVVKKKPTPPTPKVTPDPAVVAQAPPPTAQFNPDPTTPPMTAATADRSYVPPPSVAAAPALVAPPKAVAAPVAPPVAPAQATAPPPASTGDLQQDIRTTQGLLLKHRGGPGFGAGRLRGNEAQRLEGLAKDVVATLREEAAGVASQAPPPPAVSAPGPAPVAAPAAATAAAATPAATDPGRADSMVACVDGAILLYKNSPPELRDTVLVTFRAALVSAVSTCNDLLGDNANTGSLPAAASTDNVDAMMACLEGATMLYKNSPPQLQPSVLVTLRAALMTAITTCNAVIANGEVQNVQAYQAATGAATTKAMPEEYHDVIAEAPPAAPVAPISPAVEAAAPVVEKDTAPPVFVEKKAEEKEAPTNVVEALTLDDANSPILARVYQKLQGASGDGKMGLRSDMDAADADSLADDLAEMRSILVQELQEGVPAAAETKPSTSSGAKYQELLAKARAEKQ